MKRSLLALLTVALLAAVSSPAFAYRAAGTWRSTSGSIVRVHDNFSVSFFTSNGGVIYGRGWWGQRPGQFFYSVPGYGTYAAQMYNDNSLTVWGPNGIGTQWTRIAHRGNEDEQGQDLGWFTPEPDRAVQK